MIRDDDLIILIAPNVSEQMGGEAIKALQIFQEVRKLHPRTVQVTHARCRSELRDRLQLTDVYFLEDTAIDKLIWKSVVFRWFLNWWFGYRAIGMARKLAKRLGTGNRPAIIWQTEPNSPVTPRVLAREHVNCLGPINGNIYYPPAYRQFEGIILRLQRILHIPVQKLNRTFFGGMAKADIVFCAGGARTRESLRHAGVPEEVMAESQDCGLKSEFLDLPRVRHQGENLRFLHFGRLVFYKGTAQIIRSLARTELPICLDIIGRGPELQNCRSLADELGVTDRVTFIDWLSHTELRDSFSQYRGFVLPSLADSNGIVVQETMAVGLPVIGLNWGGPQLLVDHAETGYLIDPTDVEQVTSQLAAYMDTLAADGVLAEQMSLKARQRAQSWRWPSIMNTWMDRIGGLSRLA